MEKIANSQEKRRVLVFSWERDSAERMEPISRSNVEPQQVCCLSCLLIDDGGLGYSRSIPWLTTGLEKVHQVKESQADNLDWSREDWGAELLGDRVKVYSRYDEGFYEVLRLDQFQRSLTTWRDYLVAGPTRTATPIVLNLDILESRSSCPPSGD